jgi:hypothetical protein
VDALDSTFSQSLAADFIEIEVLDLTHDGTAEIILFEDDWDYPDLTIFGCRAGSYQVLQEFDGNISHLSYWVRDLNGNGVPEIILADFSCNTYRCLSVRVIEWDGNTFRSLIYKVWTDWEGSLRVDQSAEMIGGKLDRSPPSVDFLDWDLNGSVDLVLTGDIPSDLSFYINDGPWRNRTDVYSWNGEHFVPNRTIYSTPYYRFQAIQDADRAATYGDWDSAVVFYERVISDPSLNSWSPAIQEQWIAQSENQLGPAPTPTNIPADPDEWPILAAYARYRIIIIHIVQGDVAAARDQFNQLINLYSSGSRPYLYVQLADAFLISYSAEPSIAKACTAAINFASDNPELLIPLGSTYHGTQSLRYTPRDICPFVYPE